MSATNARVVYTCGPVADAARRRRVCAQLKIPCQVAWEEVMACGFGACLVCAVPVRVVGRNADGWALGPLLHRGTGVLRVPDPLGARRRGTGARAGRRVTVHDRAVPFEPRLQVDLGAGMKFSNPVLTASGCFHYGKEFAPYIDLKQARRRDREEPVDASRGPDIRHRAAPRHRPGCSTRSVCRTPALPRSAITSCRGSSNHKVPVIASIVGHSVEEYIRVADRLRNAPGIVGARGEHLVPEPRGPVEDVLVESGGDEDRSSAAFVASRRSRSSRNCRRTSPTSSRSRSAAVRAGTYGLSVMNTALGMAIDTTSFRPKLSTFTGGLSGPAIKPIAIRCVYQVSRAFPDVPIIGQGGITSGADVAEFLLAGAWAVAVGTANFVDPNASMRIVDELREYLIGSDVSVTCHSCVAC